MKKELIMSALLTVFIIPLLCLDSTEKKEITVTCSFCYAVLARCEALVSLDDLESVFCWKCYLKFRAKDPQPIQPQSHSLAIIQATPDDVVQSTTDNRIILIQTMQPAGDEQVFEGDGEMQRPPTAVRLIPRDSRLRAGMRRRKKRLLGQSKDNEDDGSQTIGSLETLS